MYFYQANLHMYVSHLSFHPLYVVVYVWKSEIRSCCRLKKVATVFFNVYRDEDEQQFGVEQEEAEKGKRT